MTGDALPVCRHRGPLLGFRTWECHSPRVVTEMGQVSDTDCIEHCPHVNHDPTTASGTRHFEPYRIPIDAGRVAVGVITAPRPAPTLAETVRSLRRAGFGQCVHVFAEPNSVVPPALGLAVRHNPQRRGLFANWLHAARTLIGETTADFVLICEDDVLFAPCAAAALEHAIETLPRETWGYASLYTPLANIPGDYIPVEGWEPLESGAHLWGALAYCFTRESLSRLLGLPYVLAQSESAHTDQIVSHAMKELSLECHFHFPSLATHAGGENSSVGHRALPQHRAVGFRPTYRRYAALNGERQSPVAKVRSRPLRVGFVTPPLLMGGAEHWILSLLQHLDPQRITCTGVAMTVGPWAHVDIDMCRRATRLAPLVGDRVLACFRPEHGLTNTVACHSEWESLQWLCDHSDVLISWGLSDLRDWMRSLRFDGQLVIVSHNAQDLTVRPLASWQSRHVHFAAVSRIAGESFLGAPVTVLLNGGDVGRAAATVPPAETRRLWGIREGERTIGHVGRLAWEKNPLAPAQAARALGPGWRAVYVGTGIAEREVRDRVRELTPDAVFAGKYEQVGNALAALDVFLLATPAEGFCLALAEAWLCGTPTVATPVGSVIELEPEFGPLAVRVPINPQPQDLARAIKEAVSENNCKRVAHAQRVAWQHLTDRAMGRRWTEYLLSLPRD